MAGLTRRGILAGLGVALTSRAWAKAPVSSVWPQRRADLGMVSGLQSKTSAGALIAAAKLGGQVSFVLADAKTGAVLDAAGSDLPMPPASTAKAITSLYALEHLGPTHRFATRLLATGPVIDGQVRGDLILAGGGDPTLDTDDLGDMAKALSQSGVRRVAGRFCVWAGALPYVREIDPGQPCWLGYNPAICGLNLNFNRVNFVWKRAADGYEVGFDARAERFAPAVTMARISVEARDLPVFTFAQNGTVEDWTVASGALGKGGSRWLPVRRPDLYAGDVFRTLARAEGLELSEPVVVADIGNATTLIEHQSQPLPAILRDMMKYSNNMTAEVVGMAASQRLNIGDHAGSAARMTRWLAEQTGRGAARFVDHSGLGGASRISAADMIAALSQLGPKAGLGGLMKEVRFTPDKKKPAAQVPQRVVAKSGTLNFVSDLVGYMTTATGQEQVFAIYSGDVGRRDLVPDAQKEDPPGLGGWLRRARRLQLQLLQSWA